MKSSSERMAVLLHAAKAMASRQPITPSPPRSPGVRVALQISVWACAGAVSLTLMAVPTVRETPEEAQILPSVPRVVAPRTREVLPTTRVRAAVSVVMVVST